MAHVVVVEDEKDIAVPLVCTLEREGYDVTWIESGRKALAHLMFETCDIVILDLGLPDIDGLDVCRAARGAGFEGGIIVLTARSGELDCVAGLDFGADDYVSKPFGLAELQARVRALLRRGGSQESRARVVSTKTATRMRIDPDSRRVTIDQSEVALTAKEFDVVALLASNRDQVVSREQLMSQVWNENRPGSTRTLDATIGRLRKKLKQAGAQDRIVAIRGMGFRLGNGLVGSEPAPRSHYVRTRIRG